MIAYVEANFILELALKQEQAASAEAILQFAEQGKIELALPAFALAEPFSTLEFRSLERRRLVEAFDRPLRELQRSEAHEPLVVALHEALGEFERIAERQAEGLQATATRLLDAAGLIELDARALGRAIKYEQVYDLSAKDAIIYAGVIGDLRTRPSSEPKCFLSRDRKDFFHPAIKSELEDYGCRYVDSFDAGLEYLESCLR